MARISRSRWNAWSSTSPLPVFLPPTDPGCRDLPCTIPPGGEATLFTKLDRVRYLAAAGKAVFGGRPQHIVATVTSGGRTRASKAFFKPMLTENTD
jgi:hypothetical protein